MRTGSAERQGLGDLSRREENRGRMKADKGCKCRGAGGKRIGAERKRLRAGSAEGEHEQKGQGQEVQRGMG